MKSILIILSGLFMFCSLPIYSANKTQGGIPEVTSSGELKTFLKDQKIVFIDFYKDDCPPCEQFKPLYESWALLLNKQVIFIKVNASNPKTAALRDEFQISKFPTLIVLDSQRKINRYIGMEEIKKMNIKEFLAYVED